MNEHNAIDPNLLASVVGAKNATSAVDAAMLGRKDLPYYEKADRLRALGHHVSAEDVARLESSRRLLNQTANPALRPEEFRDASGVRKSLW